MANGQMAEGKWQIAAESLGGPLKTRPPPMLPPPLAPHQLLAGICLHRCSARGVSCRVTTILPHDFVTAVPSHPHFCLQEHPRPTQQLSSSRSSSPLRSVPLFLPVQPQISVDRRHSPIGTRLDLRLDTTAARRLLDALFTLEHPKPRLRLPLRDISYHRKHH